MSCHCHYRNIRKISLPRDLSKDKLNYFFVQVSKFARFYLQRFTVILNCNYCIEKISSFLAYHFQLFVKKAKSYIKNTNRFLNQKKALGNYHTEQLFVLLKFLVFTLTFHTVKFQLLFRGFRNQRITSKSQVTYLRMSLE